VAQTLLSPRLVGRVAKTNPMDVTGIPIDVGFDSNYKFDEPLFVDAVGNDAGSPNRSTMQSPSSPFRKE
jgi:hypothetical protein